MEARVNAEVSAWEDAVASDGGFVDVEDMGADEAYRAIRNALNPQNLEQVMLSHIATAYSPRPSV